jgi:hypothetical protein
MTISEFWEEARKRLPKTPEYFHDLRSLNSSYDKEAPIPRPTLGCCSSSEGTPHVAPGVWWEPRSYHKGHEKGWTIVVDTNEEDGNVWCQYINITACPNCDTKLEPYVC